MEGGREEDKDQGKELRTKQRTKRENSKGQPVLNLPALFLMVPPIMNNRFLRWVYGHSLSGSNLAVA